MKEQYSFSDFISNVNPDYKEFVTKNHEALQKDGYKLKIESKATGLFASYSHPKTKRSILNFFFRKKGFFTRIYVDDIKRHSDFLNALPAQIEKEIAKSGVCKRLVDPETCNPKCMMGYDFYINDNHYQKCRYNCFQFDVNSESMPIITKFVNLECEGRR
jgi:hypothetical protein